MKKKYWDELEIGDKLTSVEKKPITRLQIAQFACATDDFSPLHLDDEFAKSAGFSCAFAPGLMSLTIVYEAINHFASNISLLSLAGTFQRLVRPGDRLKANGMIIRRYQKNSEHRINLSLWCENQNGEVVMKGNSICLLFKNEQEEDRSNSKTPALSKKTKDGLVAKYFQEIKAAENQKETISNKPEEALV